jgi:hypothetical protein
MPTTTGQTVPLGTTHPLYAVWAPVWLKLAHVYEGSGGFLDGTYLMAHPREWEDYTQQVPTKPSKKLLERRALARYENVGQTILDQIRSALFRGTVSRTIGKDADTTKAHPLATWWQNVDANGTGIDDYMTQTWTPCGLFGHVAHLMDHPAGPTPATKADQASPYLRAYTALDMCDWLTNDTGALTAVKLLEAEPRTDLKTKAVIDKIRARIVTTDTWEVIASDGATSGAAHGFGRLPVVLQYSKRRALQSVLGQSVLNDPMLYIDLYNLTSELRELLRKQTFSILNIVLGTGADAMPVQKAIEMLNATGGVGTENVLFSGGESQYITADAVNVKAYQDEREKLLRTIYRLAGVPWEADSRDAEATGSLKLKREDMNQILASYADECEKAEYQFAELWFRAEYGERWKVELDAAQVVIRYPDTFDVTPFAEILEQAQAAVAIDMPPAFMRELRRRLIAKFLPDATPAVMQDIDAQLEEMAKQPAATGMAKIGKIAQLLKAQGQPAAEEPPVETKEPIAA